MDHSLKYVLAIIGIYALAGAFPLVSAYKSHSRTDRLVNGFVLIFFASFVLTILASVTGIADQIANTNKITQVQRNQLAEFMQCIIFAGFMFTFLYGAVGVNIFTSALIHRDNAELIEFLRRIEGKVDKVSTNINNLKKIHWVHIILNVVLIVIGLIIFKWVF